MDIARRFRRYAPQMRRGIFNFLDLTDREKSNIRTELSLLLEDFTKDISPLLSSLVRVVYLEGASRKNLGKKLDAVADKTEWGLDASQQLGRSGLFCGELLQLRLVV